ncbi:hypothetical protein [Desulfovibrio inopinatus]|uniref:hypothetical protein n=1 Tax=Desulfovibrio inopinatus TaxID=102109 RepID=UPI0004860F88|nr:hypothetical protein [Desulfovibrio inopinatus]
MTLTERQMNIVQTVADFDSIDRYQGTLPRKHAFMYDEKDINELVHSDILQWVKLTFPCGKGVKGLRLTSTGRKFLEGPKRACTSNETLPTPSQLDLLCDIVYTCRISLFRGIMPKSMIRQYAENDVEELYLGGFILRIKIRLEDGEKLKGFILTAKANRLLKELALI